MTRDEFDAIVRDFTLEPLDDDLATEAEKLRRAHWRVLRRLLLQNGATAEQYIALRRRWRAALAAHLESLPAITRFKLVPRPASVMV